MITVKQVSEGSVQLPDPIYINKPYIVLGTANDNIVVFAGSIDEIRELPAKYAGYYDDCEVKVREHDLHMNDNRRIDEPLPERPASLEAIAKTHSEVGDLLNAYEHCLEEIGNQRTMLSQMNEIMTGMQQTINGLILEVESLRPLLDKGAEMRQAQSSYYNLRRQSQSKKLNDAQRVLIEQQAREWLVTSKIIEKDFDQLVTKAMELRNQTPPEPDQPELL